MKRTNTEEKRLNTFLLISGTLFVFSLLSIIFKFDSLIKDIVYAAGFLVALIIHLYYRKKIKQERE